jgi:hypothetical protein
MSTDNLSRAAGERRDRFFHIPSRQAVVSIDGDRRRLSWRDSVQSL